MSRSWRLNERHYGALQGRSRAAVRAEFGDESFGRWRRSYEAAPPPIDDDDPTHPRRDPRYAAVPLRELPTTESLADVRQRLLPYWRNAIAAHLVAGRVTLVVAHGNSLRALCMSLDNLSPEKVRALHIPTGVPLRYDLDETLVPQVPGGTYLDPSAAGNRDATLAPGVEVFPANWQLLPLSGILACNALGLRRYGARCDSTDRRPCGQRTGSP